MSADSVDFISRTLFYYYRATKLVNTLVNTLVNILVNILGVFFQESRTVDRAPSVSTACHCAPFVCGAAASMHRRGDGTPSRYLAV